MARAELVALFACVASVAQATELRDYTVVPGDTCPSIAKKLFGPKASTDVIHANNALGPPPHKLVPGQILRVPVIDPAAHLTAVRNLVETYTPRRALGHANDALWRGHRVNTLASATAEVTFSDHARLELGEETLVVILGETAGTPARQATAADATLLNGSLRSHLGELVGKPPMHIATPGGDVGLTPGETRVHVDATHTTRLAVYSGTSRLRSSGTVVTVPSGFGSRADEGLAPTPPRPLPGAPIWSAPPTAIAVEGGLQADYHASDNGPAPASWHIQLARDDAFKDLVLDLHVPLAKQHVEAKRLPLGRYVMRVSAIDADQFEGAYGDVATITLEKAPPRPVGPALSFRAALDRESGTHARLVVNATNAEGLAPPDGVLHASAPGVRIANVTRLAPGFWTADVDRGSTSSLSLTLELAATTQTIELAPAPH